MRRLVVCAGLLALLSAVVAHAGGPPSDASDCALFPLVRIDDSDQTSWKHRSDHSYGTFRSLVGIAPRAKWGYQSGRLPSVVDTRRGAFTCTVIPTAGGTKFTPFPGTALAAARRYAQRLSLLCGDVFAAYF